jgi:ABC-2 type transport system permease protein
MADPFQEFFRYFFESLGFIFLFIIPILTMRLLAEEKRSGTAELLFTYPIPDWGVILGKFIAVLLTYLTILLFTFCYILIFSSLINMDWGQVASGYLGLLLLGGACSTLGLFASSLTQNQIIAIISTFALLLLLYILGFFEDISSWGGILANLSPWKHLSNMARGVIDTKDLLFYLCFTYFFLFLTKRQLESRRWRA